jgi:hypothetical protein
MVSTKIPSPCSQEGCNGHLAKFQDCLTEALWEISMYAGESTGSTEAYGHFTLIHIEAEEIHIMGADLGVDESAQGPAVTIPAGWYMISQYDRGDVYHDQYDTESEATEAWTAADQEYSAWLDINEPDDDDHVMGSRYERLPAPNAGSTE